MYLLPFELLKNDQKIKKKNSVYFCDSDSELISEMESAEQS